MDAQANLVAKPDGDEEEDEDEESIKCYIYHARGDHDSIGFPNGKVTVTMKNRKFMDH